MIEAWGGTLNLILYLISMLGLGYYAFLTVLIPLRASSIPRTPPPAPDPIITATLLSLLENFAMMSS